MGEKVWDDAMGEISGFGGGYEDCCRAMVLAGIKWLDEHPTADPQFHGYRGVYGVITEDNEDAKSLTAAVITPANGDCTGAMHQASIGHCLAYKRLGWEEYRRQLIERESRPEGSADDADEA